MVFSSFRRIRPSSICPGGISLTFFLSSQSAARNCDFEAKFSKAVGLECVHNFGVMAQVLLTGERRGAHVVPTTPQVFDLLDYLIRNRERVVCKDELINAVWNGRIVSDAARTREPSRRTMTRNPSCLIS
jgi:hypothetical protein